MNAYVYWAALLCEDCALRERVRISATYPPPKRYPLMDDPHREDSDKWPQGPYSDGGGEADSPQCCDRCFKFLENPITEDGYQYVKEAIAEHFANGRGREEVLREWSEYYGIPFDGPSHKEESSQGG